MKVLWQKSPLTASSVIEHLKQETNWSPKTIQTLISRLVKKGALCVDKDANLYLYFLSPFCYCNPDAANLKKDNQFRRMDIITTI